MLSRSPSPDSEWQMETDAVLAEIAQLEHKAPAAAPINGLPPPVSANTVAVTSPTMLPKPPPDLVPNKIVSKFVSGQKKKDGEFVL